MFIKCNEHKLVKILNRLLTLLKMINYINNENHKLNIYFILIILKKNINDKDNKLAVKEINSGYSDIIENIFLYGEIKILKKYYLIN